MDCSTPGFPVLHYLLELAQIHVHWVGDAIQPFHPLLPSSPFASKGNTFWVACGLLATQISFQLNHIIITACGGGGVVAKFCVTLCDCSPPSSSVHGISWEGYWSGLPFPSPGDLLNPGMGIFLNQGLNPGLLLGSQILYHWATWEALITVYI